MKKFQFVSYAFCFLLSAFCFLPSTLFAQKRASNNTPFSAEENKKAYFWIGLGPTVDWFVPTTNEFELLRNKSKTGFIAGINTDIAVTKDRFLYFSTGLVFRYLQAELSFFNKYDFGKLTEGEHEYLAVRTYQTMYLALPTGIKFRTNPSRGCVFSGKLGLYHNFRIGGSQFDYFEHNNDETHVKPDYYIYTPKKPNKDASLFAESGYIGLGFEYVLSPKARVFIDADYSCQFNYFSNAARNNINNAQFKSVVHSLHIIFGIIF
jgi:hypothetical protein